MRERMKMTLYHGCITYTNIDITCTKNRLMDAWEYEKVHRELAIDLQRRQLEIHIQVSNSGSSVYDESELTD